MERDIIISAFACGGKMSCKKEAEKFAEPPLVLTVPGGSSSGFRKTGMKYKKNNTILDNFLKAKAKNVTPRRICLVTFSAGWAWSTEILRIVPGREWPQIVHGPYSDQTTLRVYQNDQHEDYRFGTS
jgi:hypothetical protein